ncbi:MAG: hypothetical protein HQ402_03330 [Parcubacteria group bacterium]|nr:hypothetical protein [Parcubacteria group bacterium]
MFLVLVYHESGNGIVASPALITNVPTKALETARQVEDLGYDMNGSKSAVVILRPHIEHVFLKEDFEIISKVPKGHPIVFERRRVGDGWVEIWIQEKFKGVLEGEPEEVQTA